MNRLLEEILDGAENVVLLGHLHPDGDCIGSCLGLYNYLFEQRPDLKVELFLESPSDKFSYLKNFTQIKTHAAHEKKYDVCITLDSSDEERLGEFRPIFKTAAKTFCIDHHITNQGFADQNYIKPDASSCGEVLYTLLDEEKISKDTAECIYTGIIHDTGVFKYSNTSSKTMTIAGKLMEKGLDCARIIDDSFYRKTYLQNQILGRALLESILLMDGRCIFSEIKANDMEFYGVDSKDMDGIIDQLRVTEGVECAIFIYEKMPGEYKVSMRSKKIVDVSKVASYFGGGGHVRAAGCTVSGSTHDVLNNLAVHIEEQLNAYDKQHNGANENVSRDH